MSGAVMGRAARLCHCWVSQLVGSVVDVNYLLSVCFFVRRLHVCVCVCVCVCACVRACVRMCMCMCVHVRTDVYMCDSVWEMFGWHILQVCLVYCKCMRLWEMGI